MNETITEYNVRPVVLVVLDGWGVSAPHVGNVIASAPTPRMDELIGRYHTFVLQASGEAVGQPRGEIGSSEVGHTNIGAGRIVLNSLPRINEHILSGTFFDNEVLVGAFEHARKHNSNVHFMGLTSDGGVHSYQDHLYALLDIAQKQQFDRVFVHAILDGRDTLYNSAAKYMSALENYLERVGIGRLVSMIGRFWAMDRDNRWDRVEAAYKLLTEGAGDRFATPSEAIEKRYADRVYDEEMPATSLGADPVVVQDNDAVVFFNFRPDRARQLTKAFVDEEFGEFERLKKNNVYFVTLTNYDDALPVRVAFPDEKIDRPIGRVVAEAGMKQMHIAETEKYAHVTYFFDGGSEQGFSGEDKVLVPSPKVTSYAEQPEMSAEQIVAEFEQRFDSGVYDFFVLNFANADMVGHTGDLKATHTAVEVVDTCVGRVVDRVLAAQGGVVITADHGNAEQLIDPHTGMHLKDHTTNPVPCIIIGQPWEVGEVVGAADLSQLTPGGILADVAPTVLRMMGLEIPKEMTGRSLI